MIAVDLQAPPDVLRCLFCGLEIERSVLQFCSERCWQSHLFGGEPELPRLARIAAGDIRPADTDPSLRYTFRPDPVAAHFRRAAYGPRRPRVEMIHRSRSYTLTAFERETVKRLAAEIMRDSRTKTGHRAELKMGDQSALAVNVVGFGGELAFCRLFNVCPDLDVKAQAGTYDAVLPNGLRVDVKTVMPENPHLIVPPHKGRAACDVYVLMQCETRPKGQFTYVGFMPAAEYHKRAQRRDLGHGLTLFMDRAELDPGLPL